MVLLLLEKEVSISVEVTGAIRGVGIWGVGHERRGGENVRRAHMRLEAPRQREKEAISDDFRQSVGNSFRALLLLDIHPRREGAGFQGVGTGESVCGFERHWLEDLILELFGSGRQRRLGRIEGVKFWRELFRWKGGFLGLRWLVEFDESVIILSVPRQFPCSKAEGCKHCCTLTDGVVAVEIGAREPLPHLQRLGDEYCDHSL